MGDMFELELGAGGNIELLPNDEVGNVYFLEDIDVAEMVRLMFLPRDEKFTLDDLNLSLKLLSIYKQHSYEFRKFLIEVTA